MVFKYKGLDGNGKKCSGLIEATDLEDAKRRIKSKGQFYTSIKEEGAPLFGNLSFKRKKTLKPTELSILSRDLSIYLKSGISIVNALRLATNQYSKNPKLANFLNAIITLLDEGKSFHQA